MKYKIVQNYLQHDEYEYAHDYSNIYDALEQIEQYQKEDIEDNKCFSYSIVDEDYNEINIEQGLHKLLSDATGIPVDEIISSL